MSLSLVDGVLDFGEAHAQELLDDIQHYLRSESSPIEARTFRDAHGRPGIPNTDSMDSLPSHTVPGPAPSPQQRAVQQASAAKATPLADVCIVQRCVQLPPDVASSASSRSSHRKQHKGRAGSSTSQEYRELQCLLESEEGDSTFSQAGGETGREADTPRPAARRAILFSAAEGKRPMHR